jgi:hypothetical protein
MARRSKMFLDDMPKPDTDGGMVDEPTTMPVDDNDDKKDEATTDTDEAM